MQTYTAPSVKVSRLRQEPASAAYKQVSCPTIIIPAGPTPERVTTERAMAKMAGVDAAYWSIRQCQIQWIPETVHDIGYHKPRESAEVVPGFLSVS